MDATPSDDLISHITTTIRETIRDELSDWLRRSREPPPLLSVEGVARRLSVSVRTVESLIAEGEIAPVWVRGQRRFTVEAVDAFIRSCPGGRSNLRRKPHRKRR